MRARVSWDGKQEVVGTGGGGGKTFDKLQVTNSVDHRQQGGMLNMVLYFSRWLVEWL